MDTDVENPFHAATSDLAGALTEEQECESVKSLLKQLEKASKAIRTYGPSNSLSQKFFQQCFHPFSTHLDSYHMLNLIVQRSELFFRGQPVYRGEHSENLAFKLSTDGIRELAFHEGLTEQDLRDFLDALWGDFEEENSDDDIVTRMWEKKLSTISFVTAEEILQASRLEEVVRVQESETLNAPVSDLKTVQESERRRPPQEPARAKESSDGGGLVGYEISAEELQNLEKEIQEESKRDSTTYILRLLSAILHSEQSKLLLAKLFQVLQQALEPLVTRGEWTLLNRIMDMLKGARDHRSDWSEEQQHSLHTLLKEVSQPERIKQIESFLNKNPDASTEGLLDILLQFPPRSVPSLCACLANLEFTTHQEIASEALHVLAKDQLEPLLRSLSDRRDIFVLNLLAIFRRLRDPRVIEPLEKLFHHADSKIRKEAINLFGVLNMKDDGTKLVEVVRDPSDSVRMAALKILSSGTYKATLGDWEGIVNDKGFSEKPSVEKRNIFYAMCRTIGDDSAGFLQKMLTDTFWVNRRKKEENATLAAYALGKLGTAAAVSALQAGQHHRNQHIREASSKALVALEKRGHRTVS